MIKSVFYYYSRNAYISVKNVSNKHKMLICENVNIQREILKIASLENSYYSNSTASRCKVSLKSQVSCHSHYKELKCNIIHSFHSYFHLVTPLRSYYDWFFLISHRITLQWSHNANLMWTSFGDFNVESPNCCFVMSFKRQKMK